MVSRNWQRKAAQEIQLDMGLDWDAAMEVAGHLKTLHTEGRDIGAIYGALLTLHNRNKSAELLSALGFDVSCN